MSDKNHISHCGLYIHIPLCRSKCVYCDFYSVASMSKKDMLLECMREEIISRSRYWEGKELATIYIGGGTPSLLDGNDVEALLHTVREYMTVSPTAEITIEANPDDISSHKTRQWIDAGINRVSIGVQSFCDDTLGLIGRRHTGEKARESIAVLRECGIENISLDIIYGIPGRSDDVLLDDICTAVATGVKHISAYALTREEGTIMDKMIKRGTFPPLDDEMMERQYHIVCTALEKEGFIHYEVSNFAKNGYRSRHNSAYWKRVPYIGVGPAAHSFYGSSRRWNVSSVASYIKGIKENTVYWEEEELVDRDVHNEIVMTSLRCVEGIDLGEIRDRFGDKYAERIKRLSVRYIEGGLLTEDNDRIKLTRRGVFLSDGIEADFFLTEDDK